MIGLYSAAFLFLSAFSIQASGAASAAVPRPVESTSEPVQVEIFENLTRGKEFELHGVEPIDTYREEAFGFVRLPTKYSRNALPLDRSSPFAIRSTYEHKFRPGHYEFRLRARGAAQLIVDGRVIMSTEPQKANSSGNDPVPPEVKPDIPGMRAAHYPIQEKRATLELGEATHRFTLVAVIGGKGLTPDPGELAVAFGVAGEMPRLLGPDQSPLLTDAEWEAYTARQRAKHRKLDEVRRLAQSAEVRELWDRYHERVREWMSASPAPAVPVVSSDIPVLNEIDRFIGARLESLGVKPTEALDDFEFLRRLALDTVGLIPTPAEVRQFIAQPSATRRQQAIEYYLAHDGWADHWVSYWQDVLAENPGILKPDLNNSGPFRWWLHQSFRDEVPFDRMVVELIEMEGSVYQGAPAAFKLATLNDSPLAAKADVLSQAFLGERLSCARCHDAPRHPHKQQDTFALAAMLEGKALKLPASSTVPFVEGFRRPRVDVTLAPGQAIDPHWPFEQLAAPSDMIAWIPSSERVPETRRQVAAMVVTPENERFAKVIVNRVWKRYFGAGLVEPAEDWYDARASHPELLEYLAREFVLSGYDLKAFARLLFSSHLYHRRPVDAALVYEHPESRLFRGPARRRLTAEQLVDSLFLAAGKRFDCEELNLNPAGNRPLSQFLNLGRPERAWEFTALMNERDRPALALPVAQSIVDVLTTFGWRQSRQNPVTVREDGASPMQTLLLANGVMGTRIVRLSDDSAFTELALSVRSVDELTRETFLRILGRFPSENEIGLAVEYLGDSFATRRANGAVKEMASLAGDTRVTWGNHLSSEATVIRMEEERRLRMGAEPTGRLSAEFRERYEDLVWSLVNLPEFILVP